MVDAFRTQYRPMSLRQTEKAAAMAARYGVSKVARGPGGFLAAYRKAGGWKNLSIYWKRKREAFIARHVAQLQHHHAYRIMALRVWAYNPEL